MDLVNPIRLAAGYTVAIDKQGRESLVVMAKGTYGIPSNPHEAPRLLDTPCPLVTTDEFFGEPGSSAVKYENDFAPCKPRCDVLLNGSCHAPGGQPATEVTVDIRVAGLTKAFRVVGHRRHGRFRRGWGPGAPELFTRRDHHAPFLPPDFDTRYFQSSPEDQQIDPPRGGEDVALLDLTPQGRTMFKLPADLGLPVLFVGRDGQATEVPAIVDTLLLEPDEGRFMLVWRASLALRRNVREIVQVQVGKTRERLLAQRAHAERLRGKQQFASLAEAAAWAAQVRRDEARGNEGEQE